jgi:hypothetical protein
VLPAAAAPLLSPTTTTYGGIINTTNFVTGASTAVFSPPSNGWPAGQGPTKAVDGLIGSGSKYLNLNITNTAILSSGTTARVPGRMELWVAEDAVQRDPASVFRASLCLDGSALKIIFLAATGPARRFYRVEVSQP